MMTIRHTPVHGNFDEVVVASRIVYLSKTDDGKHTLIHLDTGEILVSKTSMNTLEARLNSDD